MALTDENGGMNTTMLVSPANGNMGGSFGDGFGNSGWWIILLFILLGGWGNSYGGGMGGNSLYPWMNQAEITSDGFRDQMLNNNITSIRDSIGDISTQLCNGFAGVEQGANARQIANMQQSFANQTAMMQGFNTLGSQFADCCRKFQRVKVCYFVQLVAGFGLVCAYRVNNLVAVCAYFHFFNYHCFPRFLRSFPPST